MATDKRLEQINKLADIWLDQVCSSDGDAGWEGDSVLARLIEFGGDLPGASGNDQADRHMLRSIQLLRRRHALFPLAHLCLSKLDRRGRLALLGSRFYERRVDDRGRRYTSAKIASAIGLGLEQYRYHLKTARGDVAAILALRDQLLAVEPRKNVM